MANYNNKQNVENEPKPGFDEGRPNQNPKDPSARPEKSPGTPNREDDQTRK